MNKKIKPYDHRGMILNPLEWPCYPRLPLKKPNKGQVWPEMAFMEASTRCMTPSKDKDSADPDKPFTIFLGLMYEKPGKSKTFPNVDALLADGWEVD